MCRCYKVCRLCSCTGLVFAGGFLSQPGASKAGRYLTSFPFSSYERPARLLPAVAVASIHELPRRVLLGNSYSPGGRSLMRDSATRAGEPCTTPLVVASVLLRSLRGLEICESSFGDLYPSARHHIPGRLAFQVSVVPQSKHNFTVQVAIALITDGIYSQVLRDVV